MRTRKPKRPTRRPSRRPTKRPVRKPDEKHINYLAACKKSLRHHKSFYDAKKHKMFDHKEHSSIMRKIKCAEAIMEYARLKRI
jgi:hypothetical protein